MRWTFVIALMGSLGFFAIVTRAEATTVDARPKSVLFVLSSHGKGEGKERPGYEMDELAQAWSIFKENHFQTAFASPRGGAIEADKFNPADPAIAEFLADPGAVAALAGTLALRGIDPVQYDAIYVVGGKGAMLDLATDTSLTNLIGTMYDQGRVVAAICHGSAALANVRLASGDYLVKGRGVTGFSAEEEAIFSKQWIEQFPFEIEGLLRERGGLWRESPLMMPGVAVDGRLVTGQNPYSTGLVVDAVLRAMGVEPTERAARKDEASLALIERTVKQDQTAAAELASSPQDYQPALIAIIGHYQLQAARDEESVRAALAAMELAAPHFQANELSVSRAEALWRLGRAPEAREILNEVLAQAPEMKEALNLQGRLQAGQ